MTKIFFKYDSAKSHYKNLVTLIKSSKFTRAEVKEWHISNFPNNKKGLAMIDGIFNALTDNKHLWDISMSVLANVRIIESLREFDGDTSRDIVDNLVAIYPFLNKKELEAVIASIF